MDNNFEYKRGHKVELFETIPSSPGRRVNGGNCEAIISKVHPPRSRFQVQETTYDLYIFYENGDKYVVAGYTTEFFKLVCSNQAKGEVYLMTAGL